MIAAWLKIAPGQNGTWVAFKQFGKWTAPSFLSLTPGTLDRYRKIVRTAFEAWLKKNPQPAHQLGFVPRTFAISALDTERIWLKRVADADILLDFALFQPIRCYPGTRESGALGRGTRLPSVYKEISS